MSIQAAEWPLTTEDGHGYVLAARIPANPRASLLWLPALGVAARHYVPFAESLAAQGVAVFLHEMRGNGSSSLRASREVDWGYREILTMDIVRSHAAMVEHCGTTERVVGGHSIGAQFAACHAGLHVGSFERLWMVASGSPYWRNFPAPRRYAFPFAFRFMHWLADVRGTLPGRTLGFGGDEARTLMHDWIGVGLSNHYVAAGMDADLEAALGRVSVPATAVMLARDWFAPLASMRSLLGKMPASPSHTVVLDGAALGAKADHFAWMKQPQAVAATLSASLTGAAA